MYVQCTYKKRAHISFQYARDDHKKQLDSFQ